MGLLGGQPENRLAGLDRQLGVRSGQLPADPRPARILILVNQGDPQGDLAGPGPQIDLPRLRAILIDLKGNRTKGGLAETRLLRGHVDHAARAAAGVQHGLRAVDHLHLLDIERARVVRGRGAGIIERANGHQAVAFHARRAEAPHLLPAIAHQISGQCGRRTGRPAAGGIGAGKAHARRVGLQHVFDRGRADVVHEGLVKNVGGKGHLVQFRAAC